MVTPGFCHIIQDRLSYMYPEIAEVKDSRALPKLPVFFETGESGFDIVYQRYGYVQPVVAGQNP